MDTRKYSDMLRNVKVFGHFGHPKKMLRNVKARTTLLNFYGVRICAPPLFAFRNTKVQMVTFDNIFRFVSS